MDAAWLSKGSDGALSNTKGKGKGKEKVVIGRSMGALQRESTDKLPSATAPGWPGSGSGGEFPAAAAEDGTQPTNMDTDTAEFAMNS